MFSELFFVRLVLLARSCVILIPGWGRHAWQGQEAWTSAHSASIAIPTEDERSRSCDASSSCLRQYACAAQHEQSSIEDYYTYWHEHWIILDAFFDGTLTHFIRFYMHADGSNDEHQYFFLYPT